jgi:hypothetical protein
MQVTAPLLTIAASPWPRAPILYVVISAGVARATRLKRQSPGDPARAGLGFATDAIDISPPRALKPAEAFRRPAGRWASY